MDAWTILSLSFAGVILSAWLGGRRSPNWYLWGVPPLLYGGAVAWLFLDAAPLLALRVILFGALLPAAALLWLWWGRREEGAARRRTSGTPPPKPYETPPAKKGRGHIFSTTNYLL